VPHDHVHASHAPREFGWRFALAAFLNISLVVVQVVFGLWAGSIALIADAGHNFGDALGLLLAWAAFAMSRWRPTRRYTYGFGSASILAALANAIILLVATGAIILEAARRLFEPGEVAGATVMMVAAIGILVNAVAAWLLASAKNDLNIRGAFLHLLADAAISLGVVAAGAIILLTGWTIVDPLVSLAVSVAIIWGTWDLLRDSLKLSMSAVPPRVDAEAVRAFLADLPGVKEMHDLHIWPVSTTETALTCHLVIPGEHPGDQFFQDVGHELHRRFGIEHATVQIELGNAGACPLAPEHVM
jgi:cobalt-zinc-cadmium efflux system protein